ncbi:hypothetical protein FRB94_009615 [Tulasnella sp. JGI-2019a]|nr:hypothetical protein FRB94_009615 [Tulasnella sp. JGI-2019a]KAG9017755.1 hypothetical protein FRB93_004566 [Tulasnella sp. JGI-2019a]
MPYYESHNYGYISVNEPETCGDNEMAESGGYSPPQPNNHPSYSPYTAQFPTPHTPHTSYPYSPPPNLQQPRPQQVPRQPARQSTYKGFATAFHRDARGLKKAKQSWNPFKAIMRIFRPKTRSPPSTHPQPGPQSNTQEWPHAPAPITFPEPHHVPDPYYVPFRVRSAQPSNMPQMNGPQNPDNMPY